MKQMASKIFNREKLIQNKIYSAKIQPKLQYNPSFIFDKSATVLAESISGIRKIYKNIAIMGQSPKIFLKNAPINVDAENIFICDICQDLLKNTIQSIEADKEEIKTKFPNAKIYPIVLDEEYWPFNENSLDIIVNNLNIHWVNDLSIALKRMEYSLVPDGILIASIFGDTTLQELRTCFTLSEHDRYGGVSPHTSPLASITEIGNLINRVNFRLPTVFSNVFHLNFNSTLELLQFLQEMGENNALINIRDGIYKETLIGAIAIYESMFKDQDKEDLLYATFELIYFTGWKFHQDQLLPSKPKSAKDKLVTMDDLKEQLANEDPNILKTMRSGYLTETDIIENEIFDQNKINKTEQK